MRGAGAGVEVRQARAACLLQVAEEVVRVHTEARLHSTVDTAQSTHVNLNASRAEFKCLSASFQDRIGHA